MLHMASKGSIPSKYHNLTAIASRPMRESILQSINDIESMTRTLRNYRGVQIDEGTTASCARFLTYLEATCRSPILVQERARWLSYYAVLVVRMLQIYYNRFSAAELEQENTDRLVMLRTHIEQLTHTVGVYMALKPEQFTDDQQYRMVEELESLKKAVDAPIRGRTFGYFRSVVKDIEQLSDIFGDTSVNFTDPDQAISHIARLRYKIRPKHLRLVA